MGKKDLFRLILYLNKTRFLLLIGRNDLFRSEKNLSQIFDSRI